MLNIQNFFTATPIRKRSSRISRRDKDEKRRIALLILTLAVVMYLCSGAIKGSRYSPNNHLSQILIGGI